MKNGARKLKKINHIITAWETLAPTATFGGQTLAQFKAKVQPVFDQQEKLSALDAQWTEAQQQQAVMLNAGHAAALLAVNGVKGDPAHGENSPLYAAMGYVRKSDRKSGLSRKAGKPA